MNTFEFPSRPFNKNDTFFLCENHTIKLQETTRMLNEQSKKIDKVSTKVDSLSNQLDQLNSRTFETEKTVKVISDNIGIITEIIKSEQNKIGFKAVIREAAKQTSIYGSFAAGLWLIISNLEHIGTWLSKLVHK